MLKSPHLNQYGIAPERMWRWLFANWRSIWWCTRYWCLLSPTRVYLCCSTPALRMERTVWICSERKWRRYPRYVAAIHLIQYLHQHCPRSRSLQCLVSVLMLLQIFSHFKMTFSYSHITEVEAALQHIICRVQQIGDDILHTKSFKRADALYQFIGCLAEVIGGLCDWCLCSTHKFE